MAGGACQFFAVKTPKGNDFLGEAADLPGYTRVDPRQRLRANAAHYEALC
jgi:hypothetical protein